MTEFNGFVLGEYGLPGPLRDELVLTCKDELVGFTRGSASSTGARVPRPMAAWLGARCVLACSNRRVELARGRRGVRAGGEEERGMGGGIGKRDGHAVWAGLGHMGAKRQ